MYRHGPPGLHRADRPGGYGDLLDDLQIPGSGVTRALVPLSMTTIGLLPARCRGCVAWELDADAIRSAVRIGDTEFEKEVWLSGVMLTWGSAGQVVTVDDVPVGFALFAPPTAVPGAAAFPTSPVSPDAVLLTTARIHPEFTGQGLARYLLTGVVRELTRRGVRAIEMFGREEPATRSFGSRDIERLGVDEGEFGWLEAGRVQAAGVDVEWAEFDARGWAAADVPVEPAAAGDRDDDVPPCLLPAGFARAVGFEVVAAHHRYPRLRLELGRDIGWKAEVESALEKLFTVITVPASPSPVAELAGRR